MKKEHERNESGGKRVEGRGKGKWGRKVGGGGGGMEGGEKVGNEGEERGRK